MSSLNSVLSDLNTLSSSLVSNLNLLGELNSMAQKEMREADRLAEKFLLNSKKYSKNKKKKALLKIRAQFNKAKELSDDKVQLSVQTYELVDRQIRKMDFVVTNSKTNIINRTYMGANVDTHSIQRFLDILKNVEKNLLKDGAKKTSLTTEDVDGFSKLSIATGQKQSGLKTFNASTSAVNVPKLFDDDMPVDPNEPLFCLCQQVSFGEMIMCDNPNCTIEWFHFECVKLKTKPSGNWFCSNCSTNKKSKSN